MRILAKTSVDLGEWDRIQVPILNLATLCSQILWHGEDAFVHDPTELKNLVIENLQALVKNHV